MNDDPGSSSTARPNTHTTDPDHSEGSTTEASSRNDGQSSDSEVKNKQRVGLAKKLEFVTHLQRSLDMLVWSYMCTLYYMECSLSRLIIRGLPHLAFLSPKEGLLLPAQRPHLFAIFLPAFFCILFHLVLSLPVAGEATRGYLQGGVLIDFIGQQPPKTRLTFLSIDITIFLIQCLMLAVHQDRERLKKAVFPSLRTIIPGDEAQLDVPPAIAQDHDAEERGVLSDQTFMVDNEGIELRPLNQSGREGDNDNDNDERERMGSGPYASVTTTVDMIDIMRSGNAVLGNFHVVNAVRTVGSGVQNTAAYSLRSFGYNATLAALAAERRSRLVRLRQPGTATTLPT
ncbi:uncharacterized protein PODANS_1_13150 [Podospora anserina S mat+]|uniref:Podospora anserina S mat+ genomic DNA chromosome 1, supercontig 3 n=1 Tax=Podospora anserina (strain S / ATCC MYA-4624 / DSM 980 / FGSC 10383) TaxID=515849 RepID=B2ALX6_PODAN|nr:uncharacterized protein PODANS_1_13150 [Podospora anserina S mat+]CAP64924.1 unnamed protein product [Podospora anserina S mat+]CDP23765.1 Putative protein of unknown function [Podospora anserina S mat+]